jgi:ribosomal protein S18 acetylase RimI-like enzyme
MNIRLMTINDYEKAHLLWELTPGICLRSMDDTKEGIERFLNRNPTTCFIAAEGDEILGVVLGGHDGRRGYIYHAAVKPESRNQRVGNTLIKTLEQALINEGISKVGLISLKSNVGGNRFWHAIGYSIRTDLVYRDKTLIGGDADCPAGNLKRDAEKI